MGIDTGNYGARAGVPVRAWPSGLVTRHLPINQAGLLSLTRLLICRAQIMNPRPRTRSLIPRVSNWRNRSALFGRCQVVKSLGRISSEEKWCPLGNLLLPIKVHVNCFIRFDLFVYLRKCDWITEKNYAVSSLVQVKKGLSAVQHQVIS